MENILNINLKVDSLSIFHCMKHIQETFGLANSKTLVHMGLALHTESYLKCKLRPDVMDSYILVCEYFK